MILPRDLPTHAVVAINEFRPRGLPLGHVNVSFFITVFRRALSDATQAA